MYTGVIYLYIERERCIWIYIYIYNIIGPFEASLRLQQQSDMIYGRFPKCQSQITALIALIIAALIIATLIALIIAAKQQHNSHSIISTVSFQSFMLVFAA